ncbi:MAG: hypothetical protein ACTH5C_03170 [Pseudoalteromonas prydzensis]|uniref:hypothetical protein n=1 Tax=Pseudoalteromonas prydzensis TaxID=182141 RepID=UPI003F979EB3
MYLLLSGEGSGDIGRCDNSLESCERSDFLEGPMGIIIDQLVEIYQGYEMSHLDTERVSFISESYLAKNKPKPSKKKMSLRGKKTPPETKYFFSNAKALALEAIKKRDEVNDTVIAVLFRDSDGTASANRGLWENKRNSMIEGFKSAGFKYGVPMIPKPKSEAWLLCAVKENPYQNCSPLELESGNDKAPNPLKTQLSNSLNGNSSISDLNQMLRTNTIVLEKINMPSFNTFKEDLENVVKSAL